MTKVDQAVSALQKLYSQRDALNKKIVTAEKVLVSLAKSAEKVAPAKTAALKAKAKKLTAKLPVKR